MEKEYIGRSCRPYIGITDFTAPEQVERMLRVFRENRSTYARYRLHIGAMMSQKTLRGFPTEWANVFPKKEDIIKIFTPPEEIDTINRPNDYNDWMFVLHYADYDHSVGLFNDLSEAINYTGSFVDAIQLDMSWPDPYSVLSAVEASRKQLEIILQIGSKAMEMVGNDPQKVAEKIKDYKSFITHVLIDKSMGRGLGMDTGGLLSYAEVISEEYPDLQIVFAGGLGPSSMDLINPLINKFPNMSIDAQGQLRPSGSALDPIDWDMAEDYLIKALKKLDP